MNNLNEQINALVTILKNEDIQSYAGESFWKLIQAVVFKDNFTGIEAAKDVKNLLFHMPTVLFWDKMKRYLLGTYFSLEEQVQMATKFNDDNKDYAHFVKKQLNIVNDLEDDIKVDYYANLTRCLLLTDLESDLYFKLVQILRQCTTDELEFIKQCPNDMRTKNTSMVSVLILNGLFCQGNAGNGRVEYVLTDLAKALKSCCLNFNDENYKISYYCGYHNLEVIPQMEPIDNEKVNEMFDASKVKKI